MTNFSNKNRKVFIINLMKKQVIDFLNNQLIFGDLVDGLNSLIEDFDGKQYDDFMEVWIRLEIVYAGVDYVRDYYLMNEVAVICKALIKFTQLVFAVEQEFLNNFTPTEEESEDNIYPEILIEPTSLVMGQKDAIVALLQDMNTLCNDNIQQQEYYTAEQLAKICKSIVLVALSV